MNYLRGYQITVLLLIALPAAGEEALVAVATNFSEVMERLVEKFHESNEHRIVFTTGATGALYAQIQRGAPFDIFLAADQLRPALLEQEGAGVRDSRVTYATGRLTLWSPNASLFIAGNPQILRDTKIRKIAMANPAIAPYGLAAQETIFALGLKDILSGKIVMGSNIGQAHALVATGNADAGFVALSYVLSPRNRQPGSRWDVPANMHTPIHQDAVLLTKAATNIAAREFMDFLQSMEAREIIGGFGYKKREIE